jgi:TRAP-type C4-dicarboxylate transport system permease small subunit
MNQKFSPESSVRDSGRGITYYFLLINMTLIIFTLLERIFFCMKETQSPPDGSNLA